MQAHGAQRELVYTKIAPGPAYTECNVRASRPRSAGEPPYPHPCENREIG